MAVGTVDVGGTVLPAAGKVAPTFASSDVFDELLLLDVLPTASLSAPANVVPLRLSPLELTEEPPACACGAEEAAEVDGPAATGMDT
jgi:hypothetical protein